MGINLFTFRMDLRSVIKFRYGQFWGFCIIQNPLHSDFLIAVYPGHAEGAAEGEMLEEYFSTLIRYQWCVTKVRIVNSPSSPYFFA
ncbi:MAG: hypothetical protein K6D94_02745, partial [Clostridiales bacterium]|nr:hypothetical protein [Clostridiales bacterium]